jgi:hypothetical protein
MNTVSKAPSIFNRQAAATAFTNGTMKDTLNTWFKANYGPAIMPVFTDVEDEFGGFYGMLAVKMVGSTIRSAAYHGFLTLPLIHSAIKSEMGVDVNKTQAIELLRHVQGLGVVSTVNTPTTYKDPNTGVETKGVLQNLLTETAAAALALAQYEEEKIELQKQAVIIEAKRAVKRRGNNKQSGESKTRQSHYASQLSDKGLAFLQTMANVPLSFGSKTIAMSRHYEAYAKVRAVKEDGTFVLSDAKYAELLDSTNSLMSALGKACAEYTGSQFFAGISVDGRFRTYVQGGALSYQANKFVKASTTFGYDMPINEREINIAKGKCVLSGKNFDDVNAAAGALYNGRKSDGSVDWEAATLFTDPARAICWIDANQQGFQLLSILLNDKGLMKMTNVSGDGLDKINDLYGVVGQILGFDFNVRARAKSILIPYVYGAGVKALLRDYNDMHPHVTEDQMTLWVETFEAAFPAAHALKDHIRRQIQGVVNLQTATPEWLEENFTKTFGWNMPNGNRVEFTVFEHQNIDVGAGHKTKLDFKLRIEASKRRAVEAMQAALAPNIVHAIDAYLLFLVRSKCDFDIVAVHDNYGCHSCNVPAMRTAIRDSMRQIVEEDLLNFILKQIELRPETAGDPDDVFGDAFPAVYMQGLGQPCSPEDISNPYIFI